MFEVSFSADFLEVLLNAKLLDILMRLPVHAVLPNSGQRLL